MSTRGRPFEPGNKLGRGRPHGSKNKRTLIGNELLEKHGEALVRKGIVLALKGDVSLLRALLPYVLTRPKDRPAATGPLPLATIQDLANTLDSIAKRVAEGDLPLDQTRDIINIIEERRRLIHTEELEARVAKLEQALSSNADPCDRAA
jgi:hypothetical protein